MPNKIPAKSKQSIRTILGRLYSLPKSGMGLFIPMYINNAVKPKSET